MTFEQALEGTPITVDINYLLELHEKAIKYEILKRATLLQDFITDNDRAIFDIKKENK